MALGEGNRFRTFIILFLTAVIITGLVFILFKVNNGQPVTITTPPTEPWQGRIYIGGGVNNPGFYGYRFDDTIDSLIRAAGGAMPQADPASAELRLLMKGANDEAQKININNAEGWLLEALPGIGETLAGRIVDYREKNGPFSHIYDLQNVEGIGLAIFEEIATLITVAD